jgi:hypothetical protein
MRIAMMIAAALPLLLAAANPDIKDYKTGRVLKKGCEIDCEIAQAEATRTEADCAAALAVCRGSCEGAVAACKEPIDAQLERDLEKCDEQKPSWAALSDEDISAEIRRCKTAVRTAKGPEYKRCDKLSDSCGSDECKTKGDVCKTAQEAYYEARRACGQKC